MLVIRVGKKYLHQNGKIVTVQGINKGIYSVVDDSGKYFHAFASELKPPSWAVSEKITALQPSVEAISQESRPVARQTIWGSIVESWVNIVVGFTINFTANMIILPMFGFQSLTLSKNFAIGLLYTVISLVRSFVIRRWFNGMKWGHK